MTVRSWWQSLKWLSHCVWWLSTVSFWGCLRVLTLFWWLSQCLFGLPTLLTLWGDQKDSVTVIWMTVTRLWQSSDRLWQSFWWLSDDCHTVLLVSPQCLFGAALGSTLGSWLSTVSFLGLWQCLFDCHSVFFDLDSAKDTVAVYFWSKP